MGLLPGGSWDLVAAFNWGYNPTYNWDDRVKFRCGDHKEGLHGCFRSIWVRHLLACTVLRKQL